MSEWPLIIHGDIEGACIDILSNATELASYSLDVSSNLNGFRRGRRRVEVIREGGSMKWPNKGDKPRVDFMVFAESRSICNEIAQVALGVLLRAMGEYVGYGLRLVDARVETGLFRVPDKDSDTPKYAFSLRLTCVPNP